MRPLISPDEAQRRLQLVFPRAAFDTAAANPLAGWAIAALIYVGAVADEEPQVWARPSTVLWQRATVLVNHTSDRDRTTWRQAAARNSKAVDKLLASWDVTDQPRYADNSREPLRDETFRLWGTHGVLRHRPGIKTSASTPRYALEPHFADLFDPTLQGDDLDDAITTWVNDHLDPGARLKATMAARAARNEHATTLTLPDGKTRTLTPGESSDILKGVIEQWAPQRLAQPVVLAISEPAAKVLTEDQLTLAQLGVTLDVSNLLPDALIADIGATPVAFWVIEAVATDGPITEQRKERLRDWATSQKIRPENLEFLTAFTSRNSPAARRRLKDLAEGTYAWFADEPTHELAWYQIAD